MLSRTRRTCTSPSDWRLVSTTSLNSLPGVSATYPSLSPCLPSAVKFHLRRKQSRAICGTKAWVLVLCLLLRCLLAEHSDACRAQHTEPVTHPGAEVTSFLTASLCTHMGALGTRLPAQRQ